jgi:hypothetical protein
MKHQTSGLCRENIAVLRLRTNVDLLEVIFIVEEVQIMKLDKKLKSASAAYILGLSPLVKIKGPQNEIHAFTEALKSSRALYEVLNGETSIEVVAEALEVKSAKAKEFGRVCGHSWPF